MRRLLRIALVVGSIGASASAALGQEGQMLNEAMASALVRLESALPALGAEAFDVDVAAYRDALSLQQFSSGRWGGTVRVSIQTQKDEAGQCARYAAFTRVPPQDGVVPLVLCPRFWTEGADGLRTLTLLHEMVHVVAGTDECQAMAFAARVEQAATGQWTHVDAYWRASGCAGSRYSLPD
jgi:hypothetical protein